MTWRPDNDEDWHGWSTADGKLALHIGHLPGRKSVALYTHDKRGGSTLFVHAYFRNEVEAKRALESLDYLMKGKPRRGA